MDVDNRQDSSMAFDGNAILFLRNPSRHPPSFDGDWQAVNLGRTVATRQAAGFVEARGLPVQ